MTDSTNQFTIATRDLAYLTTTAGAVITKDFGGVLENVHIAVADGTLLMTATDRYRVICVRGEATGAFTGLIPHAALRKSVQTFKTGRDAAAKLTLTLDGDTLTVTKADGDLLDMADAQLTFTAPFTVDKWPKIDHLITEALDAEPQPDRITVNPAYLQQLPSALAGEAVEIINHGGVNKPMLIAHPRWVMVVMQLRAATYKTDETRATWRALLTPPKGEANPDEQAA